MNSFTLQFKDKNIEAKYEICIYYLFYWKYIIYYLKYKK